MLNIHTIHTHVCFAQDFSDLDSHISPTYVTERGRGNINTPQKETILSEIPTACMYSVCMMAGAGPCTA